MLLASTGAANTCGGRWLTFLHRSVTRNSPFGPSLVRTPSHYLAMRIAHITNFYGPTATAQIEQLHRSAATYKSAGHEFIAFVPSYQLATVETDDGKIINLPSLRIPLTSGRRIITNKKMLKTILMALDLDQIEIINQPLMNGLAKWAAGRNIKVLKSNSPVEVIESTTLARRGLISIPA